MSYHELLAIGEEPQPQQSVEGIDSPATVTFFTNLCEFQHFIRGGPTDLKKSKLSAVEANWVDVQFIKRRMDKGHIDLEEILLQTGACLAPNPGTITSWKDKSTDFQLLYHRLTYLQQSAERINAPITGLASIVGSTFSATYAKPSLTAMLHSGYRH
ncbi:hypothetical protein B0T25DRAFT_521529 [Lasiosphaeria hispida]|uniref:Uncharacterized protein n=1 Tax=Lasiosphaeria hispida TaxID=260671 RepID=A0AAJ0M9B0_9PEZI|nr:hypothetical protein B0T25DRAFT_521529 [Lasiosphaeria hispida]